ncbi:MAG: hypothetical protein J6I69_02270 [Bacilli bacterium]|nr:hypothetical protein [Bacilli bacterium]
MATNEEIKKWVKERNEVLEKRSVAEVIKFMEKWEKEGFYNKLLNERFKKASPQVQLMTLCKAICNTTSISKETREWALKTLYDLGSSPEIK